MAEQVAGDDEGNGNADGRDEQLPGPKLALEEERDDREHGSDDAADNLRTEVQDDARHEAA